MKQITRLIGAVVISFGLMSAVTAPLSAAEYFGTVEPNDILKMLNDNGYKDAFVADTDYEDLPVLNFTLADSKAVIYFYECGKTGKVCEYLQLRVGRVMVGQPNYKVVNDFNAEEQFSQAYIDDENRAVIEQWITLEGGISDVNFIYTVITFGETVEKFERIIGGEN
ncbi:MAG: hypothetical protein COA62_10175 [Rhodobiaceae bacterium]|nr:MAG: hypothetical protein COA62_10175 [Rhodobiaceae bacterium]